MRLAAIFAILALASCQTPCPGPETGSRTAAFHCEDGSDLNVTFAYGATDSARVVQDGYTTLDLPARIMGSGYRYADNGAELRGRGREVRWTRPGAAETVCTETH
ncbi:MAG: MliC family protein [Hyphomonadaceae bacterium]